MTEFLSAALDFPTVFFTGVLGAMLFYWTVGLVGAIDLDLESDISVPQKDFDVGVPQKDFDVGVPQKDFDVGVPQKDFDVGVPQKDFDVGVPQKDFDVGVPTKDFAKDVDVDVDVDADAEGKSGGGFGGLLHALGLSGVPIFITISFISLYGWVVCMAATRPLMGVIGGGVLATVAATGLGLVAFIIAIPSTALSIRPIRKVIVGRRATRRHELVHRVCTVTTKRVDERFGQAELDGSDAFLVQVRSRVPNTLALRSRAVVYDYDPEHEVYWVAPFNSEKGEEE